MTLGELLGVSRSTAARIRSGRRPLMCHEAAFIADALDIPWSSVAENPLRCINELLDRDAYHSANVVQVG